MNCKNCGKELEFQGELCEECEAAMAEGSITVTTLPVKSNEKKIGVKTGVLAFVFACIAIYFAFSGYSLITLWETVLFPMLEKEAADMNAIIADEGMANMIIGLSSISMAVLSMMLCIPSFILSIVAFANFGKSKKAGNPRAALVVLSIFALIFIVASVYLSYQTCLQGLAYISAYLPV